MNNKIIEIPPHRFFKLPFESGTRQLTRRTLDSHSEFRRPKRPYLLVIIQKISFTNEILTFSISIGNEEEERVYLKVSETHLLISCSMDTDETYLSRYAYFLLDNYLPYYPDKDFAEYYWPDFFDHSTGKSKYLNIIKEKKDVKINLKRKYWSFYKPGIHLPTIPVINPTRVVKKTEQLSILLQKNEKNIIAYCLLNPLNLHIREEEEKELTLLIPFFATLNDNGRSFRSLLTYLTIKSEANYIELDDNQIILNDVCREMWKNSLFYGRRYDKDWVQNTNSEVRKARQFDLWNEALPLLLGQTFVCHQWIYNLRYIKGRPTKKSISHCKIVNEIPHLTFFLKDKGEYFSLELKFTVDGKLLNFSRNFIPFYFASSTDEPEKFYLMGSIADAEIVAYFSRINFSILVLKKHYDSHFRFFADSIRMTYGLTEK